MDTLVSYSTRFLSYARFRYAHARCAGQTADPPPSYGVGCRRRNRNRTGAGSGFGVTLSVGYPDGENGKAGRRLRLSDSGGSVRAEVEAQISQPESPASRISISWLSVATRPSIAEAEQYFSAERPTARSTLARARPRPVTM